MPEYFFELLTEEIPAWMHDGAAATLQERLTKLGNELGAENLETRVSTTPRRIAFFVRGLPLRESDRDLEVKGPPKKNAYDAEGVATQALLGFLKKQSATIDDVLDSTDEYVRIRRRIAGRDTAEILSERIAEIVQSLRWPKMMRWGAGEHSYIRPIHSIVSIFDGQPLPLSIFGIASGKSTVGHRTLAPARLDVNSYSDYVTKLELARVIVDPERRKQAMAAAAIALSKQVEGKPSDDVSIWAQWQYLTEYPGLVRAEFRREFLTLPEEVLVTVMRVHQKQLPIRDANGSLTNSFLAVIDNQGDPDGNAAYGNSFVTNARFADAKFFYETDRRTELAARQEQLSHLQFHEKLGNYLEKTKRIEQIATAILDTPEVAAAARLCKTDLVTEMVKEFTDLQGQIGGIYAREEGQPEAVWQAIYDHYLPVNIDDQLPRGLTGAVVSLADKIDTLAGFFLVGIRPTGSKDPFALRRAAQGVVQILLNRDKRQVRIPLGKLLDLAFAAHGKEPGDASEHLHAFIGERLATLLEASAWGFAYDEIRAVMESHWADVLLPDVADRIGALKAMRSDTNFLSVLDSAKRIANITVGHEGARVDAALLTEPAEKRLNDLTDPVVEQINESIAERQYRRALETFAGLAPELETFFKEVMVNVDDARLKANRMSLLRKVGNAVGAIADVMKIVVDRSDYRA